MSWLQLRLAITPEQAPTLEDQLLELGAVSVSIDLALDKLCVQRLQAVPAARVQRTCDDGKGLEVSLCSLFEDLFIQG